MQFIIYMTAYITFKTIAFFISQLLLWKSQVQPPVVKDTISSRFHIFALLTSDMLIKLDVPSRLINTWRNKPPLN